MVLQQCCPSSFSPNSSGKAVVHLVLGNHNLVHSVCFGVWILGGVTSVGDPNLEPATLAKQVH